MTRPLRIVWLVKGLGPGGAERLLVAAAAAHAPGALRRAYLLPPAVEEPSGPRARGARSAVHLPRCRQRTRPALGRAAPPPAPERSGRRRARPLALRGGFRPARGAVAAAPRAARAGDDRAQSVDDVQDARRATRTRSPPVSTTRCSQCRRKPSIPCAADSANGPRYSSTGSTSPRSAGLPSERAAVRAELGFATRQLCRRHGRELPPEEGLAEPACTAARLLADRGPRVRFCAVGQGPLEAEVEALHRELRARRHRDAHGLPPDAVRLMAGCDMFVLASEWEGSRSR